jgi:hypothetical protein
MNIHKLLFIYINVIRYKFISIFIEIFQEDLTAFEAASEQ